MSDHIALLKWLHQIKYIRLMQISDCQPILGLRINYKLITGFKSFTCKLFSERDTGPVHLPALTHALSRAPILFDSNRPRFRK
jgi:hypothetical protein